MSTEQASGDFFSKIGYNGPTDGLPEGIPRDQWGRPLILSPDGSGELVAYTRASTMAGVIDNKEGLHKWQMALVAQGIGHRADLAAVAASLPPYDMLSKAQKKDLYDVVASALEVAGAYVKANHGSAVHAFTDPTHPSGPVPEAMQADVRSHAEVIEAAGLVVLASEVFVVNDEFKVAGTFDSCIGVPALQAMVLGDTKTGKANVHTTQIQVAAYRGGQVYDHETGTRTPIEEYVASLHPQLVSLPPLHETVGLYTHIPREQGKTTLHPMNLIEGRRMLQICADVRDFLKSIPVAADATDWLQSQRNVPALKAITDATTLDELRTAYQRYAWCWNDKLDKAGATRLAELGGPRA